jgi:hypothetical protein
MIVARPHAVAGALATAAALSACGQAPPARHPGEPYLTGVDFEGNRAISSEDLRTGLALHRVQTLGIRRRLMLQATIGDRGYDGADLLWRRRW